MKKHFSFLIFCFFSFSLFAQTERVFFVYDNLYNTFDCQDSDSYNTSFLDSKYNIRVSPRLYLNTAINDTSTSFFALYGFKTSLQFSKRLLANLQVDDISGNYNSVINEFVDSLAVIPTYGVEETRLLYNIEYKFNKYFSLDLGKSSNFLGKGYRSLLLSNNSSPYNHLRLSTKFGRFKYYNLYANLVDLQDPLAEKKKHASIHFIDIAILDNLYFGVYEAVVWLSSDPSYNRGFDFNYLNPIIFFRPVEFSLNSPDNVLMGAYLNYDLNRVELYSQFMIDDMNVSNHANQNQDGLGGFFQHKYAVQLGVKIKTDMINILAEYNQVQPYSYGHKTPDQNYSHDNQALAHPLGANFKELVLITNYFKEKWKINTKLSLVKAGLDSLDTHYGQNIFGSDWNASTGGLRSYGNKNGQGVVTNLITFNSEISYTLKNFDFFVSLYYRKKNSDLLNQNEVWYSVGLRTFPFSAFLDY